MIRPVLAYGILAFVAGFIFGSLRELILIPTFGDTIGRWMEFLPLMFVVVLLGAWTQRRWPSSGLAPTLLMGILSTLVLLLLESALAIGIFKMSWPDYLAGFNVLEGELFPVGLAIMAVTPAAYFAFHRRK